MHGQMNVKNWSYVSKLLARVSAFIKPVYPKWLSAKLRGCARWRQGFCKKIPL